MALEVLKAQFRAQFTDAQWRALPRDLQESGLALPQNVEQARAVFGERPVERCCQAVAETVMSKVLMSA